MAASQDRQLPRDPINRSGKMGIRETMDLMRCSSVPEKLADGTLKVQHPDGRHMILQPMEAVQRDGWRPSGWSDEDKVDVAHAKAEYDGKPRDGV